jgi:2-polyprenyl-6-methoxyphenol hydroxylase-like FAD-dependent oxidoreductase
MTEQVPVLIVGGGGAGLAMSILLRQQGIAAVLVERRPDISWVPRARNLNFRTLEVFRGLGLEGEVRAAGVPVSRMFRRATLASPDEEELGNPAQLHPAGMERVSPEPFLWYCPQNRLEPILRAAAQQRGCDVRYGTELVAFAPPPPSPPPLAREGGVGAELRDRATGQTHIVQADYLIAADGAHSHIRQSLGIKSEGHGGLEYFIFVYFRAPWRSLIAGHEADAIQIRNAEVEGFFLVAKDDLGMFVITDRPVLGKSFEEYTAERCRKLIERAIGQPGMPVEIIDVVHFQVAESVAEEFASGRVFLVGDAAHTMPGYKGLGLNTAIQSAQNLAWKLAAVIHRQAGEGLLASYHAERHPVGRFAAHQSLTGPGVAVLLRKEALNDLLGGGDLPLFYPIVGYRYRSQAIVSEDANEAQPGEIALLDRQELTGEPGTRVPHLWLERQGRRLSTLDLIEGRFVLIAGAAGSPWCEAAPATAASLGIELAAYRIAPDAELRDPEGVATARMGLAPEGAMLIRPDGFVAWRARALPASAQSTLKEVFSSVLCRSASSIGA